MMKELKNIAEIEKQKEELRKKYENYKKLYITEKTEKDAKLKEI